MTLKAWLNMAIGLERGNQNSIVPQRMRSLPSLTRLAVREHGIVILMFMFSPLNWYECSIWYKR